MTIAEMHIQLQQGLQKINSNLFADLVPQQLDLLLRKGESIFIEEIINPLGNPKKEGFQRTQKKYDEIENLIKPLELPLYVLNSKEYFSWLPADYFQLVSDYTNLYYNCNGVTPVVTNKTISTVIVPFPDSIVPITNNGFILTSTVNGVVTTEFSLANYTTLAANILSVEEKYILVGVIRDIINQKVGNVKVYWEFFNGVYSANSFIFVGLDDNYNSTLLTNITFNNNTTTISYNNTNSILQVHSIAGNNYKQKPNRLIPLDPLPFVQENSFSKTSYKSPISTLVRGWIRVKKDELYMAASVGIFYIKRVRLINIHLGSSSEINEDYHQRLVDITIQYTKATITNKESYSLIQNENLKTS